jgi:hypothetical protein
MKGYAHPFEPSGSKPPSLSPIEEIERTHLERIARLAFELWEKDGAAYGCEISFWAEAERQLLSETLDAKFTPPFLDPAKN